MGKVRCDFPQLLRSESHDENRRDGTRDVSWDTARLLNGAQHRNIPCRISTTSAKREGGNGSVGPCSNFNLCYRILIDRLGQRKVRSYCIAYALLICA